MGCASSLKAAGVAGSAETLGGEAGLRETLLAGVELVAALTAAADIEVCRLRRASLA